MTTKNQAQVALKNNSSTTLTLAQHINELRKRLFSTALVLIVVGSVVYYYHDFFVRLIMAPLGHQKLIYLTPSGGFSFIFMVTFYVTLLATLPFLIYQIYAFLRPAIPRASRALAAKVIIAAIVLMTMGATFGYLYAVPGGLNFLNDFAKDYVIPSLTADSYLNFVLAYVFGIGALFELPLFLLFWHWIHPLTPKGLLNSQRYVIVGAFVAAAMLSPSPDALSQAIIAVPIVIVYQFGVIAVMLSIRKARKQATKHSGSLAKQKPLLKPAPLQQPRLAPARVVAATPQYAAKKPATLTAQAVKPIGLATSGASSRRSIDGFKVSSPGLPKPRRTVRAGTAVRTQSPHTLHQVAPQAPVSLSVQPQPYLSPTPQPRVPRSSLMVPPRRTMMTDFIT